jgi:hypothetical protein
MLSDSTRLPVCGTFPTTVGFAVTARLSTPALRIFALDFDAIFNIPVVFSDSSRRIF